MPESKKHSLYRWWYLAPLSENEEREDPSFLVVENVPSPDEYSGFQDFAEDDFALVDVMAFTYEPINGLSDVPRILALLRADPRMLEDISLSMP